MCRVTKPCGWQRKNEDVHSLWYSTFKYEIYLNIIHHKYTTAFFPPDVSADLYIFSFVSCAKFEKQISYPSSLFILRFAFSSPCSDIILKFFFRVFILGMVLTGGWNLVFCKKKKKNIWDVKCWWVRNGPIPCSRSKKRREKKEIGKRFKQVDVESNLRSHLKNSSMELPIIY